MLTETLIRKTKTPAKPTKLADERGMYLFLTPSGGRLWRFNSASPARRNCWRWAPILTCRSRRRAKPATKRGRRWRKGSIPPPRASEEKRAKAEAGANDFETSGARVAGEHQLSGPSIYHADTLKRFEAYRVPWHRPPPHRAQ